MKKDKKGTKSQYSKAFYVTIILIFILVVTVIILWHIPVEQPDIYQENGFF